MTHNEQKLQAKQTNKTKIPVPPTHYAFHNGYY